MPYGVADEMGGWRSATDNGVMASCREGIEKEEEEERGRAVARALG